MEKVLILSEKNTKMSPPQWIACQLHMSRINDAQPDWLFENSRPIRESGSLVLMTTTYCYDAAGIKLHKQYTSSAEIVSETRIDVNSEPASDKHTYGNGLLSILPSKDERFSRQFFAGRLLAVYSWRTRERVVDSE